MWVLHLLFAGLFLLGAVVQLNDPDPARWIAIYLLAAVVAAVGRKRRGVALAVGVLALLWSASIAVGGMEALDTAALFGDVTMKTEGVEKWRELLGLLIIAAYCLVAAVTRRASPGEGSSSDPALSPR